MAKTVLLSAATTALVLLLTGPPSVHAQNDGDPICVEGYIMDYFCIERGTLLDNPSVVTLEEPEKHSVHCLVDVGVCNSSPFHILQDPTEDGGLYGPGWSVTDNTPLLDLARSVGDDCSTCTGEGDQREGFWAAVRGVVENAGDRILRIEEVALTGTELCAAACTSDVQECSDGSFVGRVPPDCEFEECPEINCQLDSQECPDGSSVSRIPPECEFEACPTLAPTESPTESPTVEEPTFAPSASPTEPSTEEPSASPSFPPSFRPSYQPSYHPSATPTESETELTDMPTMMPTANETFVNCSEYQYELKVPGLSNVTMQYVVNYHSRNDTNRTVGMRNETTAGTLSVRIEYQGLGWIGFAVSPDGSMVGSDAVIGLPSEDGNATNASVRKYRLTSKDGSNAYVLLDEEQQTLMDADIAQDEEEFYTVLEFTRPLMEEGEVAINGTGFNFFLVAHGTDTNELGYHGPNGRSSFNLTLSPCMMGEHMEEDMTFDDLFDDIPQDIVDDGSPPPVEDVTEENTDVERTGGATSKDEADTTRGEEEAATDTDSSASEPAGAPPSLEATSGSASRVERQAVLVGLLSTVAGYMLLI